MPELAAIALLAAVAWLWYDSLKAREAAIRAARALCQAEGLLLLDDTVAVTGIRLARSESGRITLQRAYAFEYTDTGNNRLRGDLVMRGDRLLVLHVADR